MKCDIPERLWIEGDDVFRNIKHKVGTTLLVKTISRKEECKHYLYHFYIEKRKNKLTRVKIRHNINIKKPEFNYRLPFTIKE